MMRLTSMLVVTTVVAGAAGAVRADDWPNWRGPNHDNVSMETGWSSTPKPEPLWSTNVGMGHSSVAVVGDRLYAFGFDRDAGQDIIRCLDANTGEEHWRYSYPATLDANGHSGGTHSTPSVDGDRVYVANRVGILRCLDAGDGTLLWERDLPTIYGTAPTDYGFGGAPLITEGLAICNVSKTVALDKMTGEPVWETNDHLAKYSTPTTFDLHGRACIAAFTKEGLFLYDRATGEEVRQFPWRKGPTTVNASTPVVIDDKLFISSAYNHGAALVQFTDEGAGAVWESRVMRNHMAGSVRLGDRIFGFDQSVLKCIDLDGNEIWRKRGLGQGALTASDGRLIVIGEKGELVIASATSEKYEQLSKARVLKGGVCWSNPVLANGLIYCRTSNGDMVCIDARGD